MLPRGKVPVICVMIDTLSVHGADASVVLKDQSGRVFFFFFSHGGGGSVLGLCIRYLI